MPSGTFPAHTGWLRKEAIAHDSWGSVRASTTRAPRPSSFWCTTCFIPHRNKAELQDIRAFKEAAAEVAALPDAQRHYDLRLAKFYMWAQTAATVFLACRVPTGEGLRWYIAGVGVEF